MFKAIWIKWKSLAEKIGNFQAGVIFSILYFVIVVPIGLIANVFNDYFKTKKFPRWEDYEIKADSLKSLQEQ